MPSFQYIPEYWPAPSMLLKRMPSICWTEFVLPWKAIGDLVAALAVGHGRPGPFDEGGAAGFDGDAGNYTAGCVGDLPCDCRLRPGRRGREDETSAEHEPQNERCRQRHQPDLHAALP